MLTLAAVTCCALMIGVIPTFADEPIGGTQTSTEPAETVPVPSSRPPLVFAPDGDPIATPASTPQLPLSSPPVVRAGKNFVPHLKQQVGRLRSRVLYYRKAAQKWAQVMGTRARPTPARRLAALSLPSLRKQVRSWKKILRSTRVKAQNPPHLRQFLCIHHYEGSWTDTGAPYYGGLQMGIGFQQTYAPQLLYPKGRTGPMVTANHWTPLEQIWTAERAEKSRGFWPWPNTARYCGLL